MVITIWIACILAFGLSMYRFGRIVGIRFGIRQGGAEEAIRLRLQYQLEEHCPICDDSSSEQQRLQSKNQR